MRNAATVRCPDILSGHLTLHESAPEIIHPRNAREHTGECFRVPPCPRCSAVFVEDDMPDDWPPIDSG
jgi:hypothetical protein